jgi:hypothetical protein
VVAPSRLSSPKHLYCMGIQINRTDNACARDEVGNVKYTGLKYEK